MRGIGLAFGFFMVAFIVFSDCLKMVIGRGDVMGCGEMMVLARRVALGIRHDAFLPISEDGKTTYWLNSASIRIRRPLRCL
jgi:hypothetical protein